MTDSSDRNLAERLTDDEELGWRLQLAYAGLHPDATATLLDAHGAEGAVARVKTARSGSTRAAEEAATPAMARVEALAESGVTVQFRGDPGYPGPAPHEKRRDEVQDAGGHPVPRWQSSAPGAAHRTAATWRRPTGIRSPTQGGCSLVAWRAESTGRRIAALLRRRVGE